MMSVFLAALAVVCASALFIRSVEIVDGMNFRKRHNHYLQFLAFGLSQAGQLAVGIGCTCLILDGTANIWAYLLVYSAGGAVIFDRRTRRR